MNPIDVCIVKESCYVSCKSFPYLGKRLKLQLPMGVQPARCGGKILDLSCRDPARE
jgi:hypothetical protein